MNETPKDPPKLILPSENGIPNLEIRRMQEKLEKERAENSPRERILPPDKQAIALQTLEKLVSEVEKGTLSSFCFIALMPKTDEKDEGSAIMCVEDSASADVMDRVFYDLLQGRFVPPSGDAG